MTVNTLRSVTKAAALMHVLLPNVDQMPDASHLTTQPNVYVLKDIQEILRLHALPVSLHHHFDLSHILLAPA